MRQRTQRSSCYICHAVFLSECRHGQGIFVSNVHLRMIQCPEQPYAAHVSFTSRKFSHTQHLAVTSPSVVQQGGSSVVQQQATSTSVQQMVNNPSSVVQQTSGGASVVQQQYAASINQQQAGMRENSLLFSLHRRRGFPTEVLPFCWAHSLIGPVIG